jgi:hypothetical protein
MTQFGCLRLFSEISELNLIKKHFIIIGHKKLMNYANPDDVKIIRKQT